MIHKMFCEKVKQRRVGYNFCNKHSSACTRNSHEISRIGRNFTDSRVANHARSTAMVSNNNMVDEHLIACFRTLVLIEILRLDSQNLSNILKAIRKLIYFQRF